MASPVMLAGGTLHVWPVTFTGHPSRPLAVILWVLRPAASLLFSVQEPFPSREPALLRRSGGLSLTSSSPHPCDDRNVGSHVEDPTNRPGSPT